MVELASPTILLGLSYSMSGCACALVDISQWSHARYLRCPLDLLWRGFWPFDDVPSRWISMDCNSETAWFLCQQEFPSVATKASVSVRFADPGGHLRGFYVGVTTLRSVAELQDFWSQGGGKTHLDPPETHQKLKTSNCGSGSCSKSAPTFEERERTFSNHVYI